MDQLQGVFCRHCQVCTIIDHIGALIGVFDATRRERIKKLTPVDLNTLFSHKLIIIPLVGFQATIGSTLGKDLLVLLVHHDPNDPRSWFIPCHYLLDKDEHSSRNSICSFLTICYKKESPYKTKRLLIFIQIISEKNTYQLTSGTLVENGEKNAWERGFTNCGPFMSWERRFCRTLTKRDRGRRYHTLVSPTNVITNH